MLDNTQNTQRANIRFVEWMEGGNLRCSSCHTTCVMKGHILSRASDSWDPRCHKGHLWDADIPGLFVHQLKWDKKHQHAPSLLPLHIGWMSKSHQHLGPQDGLKMQSHRKKQRPNTTGGTKDPKPQKGSKTKEHSKDQTEEHGKD